jgi:hypothetical protein
LSTEKENPMVVDNQNPSNKIPTPLALTFWTTPGSGFTLTRDQIRLFFCDKSDQLHMWSFDAKRKLDDRQKVEALLDEKAKPLTSKSSSFYVTNSEGPSFRLATK